MRSFVFLLLGPAVLAAQIPRIGTLDFYGVHKVPEDRLRKAIGVREGDRFPGSKADIEDRLERVPQVVLAHLEAVCCEGDRGILYVGIEEKDAPHFEFRDPPHEEVLLPDRIVQAYDGFLNAFSDAARIGDTGEDISRGYELAANLGVREYQVKFHGIAEENLRLLRQVLRESINPQHRAAAAYIIGYAFMNQGIVDDLQYALQDPDEAVRSNGMRALTAIAALASRNPDAKIRVEPTWFIELLHSIVWSDRYRAAKALAAMTEDRPPALLALLRQKALPELVVMSQWKTPAHALPSFILLGRVAGMPEGQIQTAWTGGNKTEVIRRALGK